MRGTIRGRVKNGVIVLEDGATLPEGARVTVSCNTVRLRPRPGEEKRVQLPLVRTGRPGTLHLTNERIAEILLEEDLAALREAYGQDWPFSNR
jgi:hypothetical protein